MRALKRIDPHRFPDTAELLVAGGDARIALVSGVNEYGCRPYPDPELAEFGSSTASTISESGFAAADALRARLVNDFDDAACDREYARIRAEFASLCGISDLAGLEILFSASGTDVHRIASRLTSPDLVVMVDPSETGRGVPGALSAEVPETRSVRTRTDDAMPRDRLEIDAEIERLVESCAEKGGKVLLVLTDVSKTGMIAPSPACALEMKSRFPGALEILVDACQFRMSDATLKAYLARDFMVALTGSKFLTGPTFSGALLVPQSASGPKTPFGRFSRDFGVEGNIGLLLRWEAALAELRAFRRIPEIEVENFLSGFAGAISRRLENDPNFEPLPVPRLDRHAVAPGSGWDRIQTIFPFRLKRGGSHLGLEEARVVHALLREDLSPVSKAAGLRCSLGQPVACGALRICSSARLVVEGVKNSDAVTSLALSALDKAALLIHSLKSR